MNFKKLALPLILGAALSATAFGASATVNASEWVFSSGVPQPGAEWLTFMQRNEYHVHRNIQSKRTFTPKESIQIEFDYLAWGGANTGGDGLFLSLVDAGPNPRPSDNNCMARGDYVHFQFDQTGYYSAPTCGWPNSGYAYDNGFSIRGITSAGTSHHPLAEALDCPESKCTSREQAIQGGHVKRVLIYLTPKSDGVGYKISVSINGKVIVSDANYPYAAPETMKLRIQANNGHRTNTHEIRNLKVEAFEKPCEDPNVAQGVPAYISGAGGTLVNYPMLNDGDRVHKGWNGAGKWTGVVGFNLAGYGLDFGGAPCLDMFGACATPPSTGLATANTITVYARQDDGTETEPTDSTTFTKHGPINMRLDLYNVASGQWETVQRITNNNLVKRTFTFPTRQLKHVMIAVEKAAGTTGPSIVEMEASNK